MITENIIGYSTSKGTDEVVNAFNPSSGEKLEGDFYAASPEDANKALKKAEKAFVDYRKLSGKRRAEFLEAIADEILELGDQLVHRAMAETALPEGRIVGERGRTVGQLRLFASLIRKGHWVDATIDTALPDREPIPRPDIRKMLIPVGPVVVFTASNFPLAFSTAGGDTASALAAGNPVIVKAHESHLGTNQLVSEAIQKAAKKCEIPDGVFSSLIGSGYELGKTLVQHPKVKSVAFTGSFNGGRALFDLATKRLEPIPVFAEMGSINPVILLPEKLKEGPEKIASIYATSITLGVGQFCTNPGLIIGMKSKELEEFASSLGEQIARSEAGIMLNTSILKNYTSSKETILQKADVETIVDSDIKDRAGAAIAMVDAADFLKDPNLAEEIFGPYSLIVKCDDILQVISVLKSVSGQLTTTIMCTDDEVLDYHHLIEAATQAAGRVIFNGVPTGVEVCYAMQHGGPYPATTDSRFTSVGTDAIKRFARPVAFQSMQQSLLPDALKDANPLNIWRTIDGEFTKGAIK
jgi:NADP-dependent aldehyde dehydrogenase